MFAKIKQDGSDEFNIFVDGNSLQALPFLKMVQDRLKDKYKVSISYDNSENEADIYRSLECW